MSKAALAKSQAAVKEAKHGVAQKARRVYTEPRFHRPKVLETPPKKRDALLPKMNKVDDFRIVQLPVNSEAALKKIENNELVFICDLSATKPQIAAAVSRRFGVRVQRVNTLIRPDCKKKAFVKLHESHDASEIVSKFGLL